VSYIDIKGGGPAAAIVAAVFKTVGLQTSSIRRPSLGDARLITLNGPTLMLIKDLFGNTVFDKLLQQGVMLEHRVLAWKLGDDPIAVNDKALLVPLNTLTKLFHGQEELKSSGPLELTVEAYGRSENKGASAGLRWAFVWHLHDLVLPNQLTCYLQAVDGGWVFLAPSPKGTLVQLITAGADTELARGIAAKAITMALPQMKNAYFGLDSEPHQFDASPRFNEARNMDVAIIGDQVLALDPISGDGIGHILRSAVLLASLVKGGHHHAASPGIDIYYARLRRTLISHLTTCEQYYQQINVSNIWGKVIADMRRERLRLQREVALDNPTSYVLNRSDISIQAESAMY
jgi:hypothetical protein